MATDPGNPFSPQLEPATAPLAGTRSQSVQRLQIGLFGLAAMILLVSLANIILNSARENEARVVPEAAPTVPTQSGSAAASDPLAGAGVVPDMPDVPEAQAAGEDGGGTDDAPALRP